jgi:hypothetical protein
MVGDAGGNGTGWNRSLHWRDGFHAVLTEWVIFADGRFDFRT